MSDSEIWMPGLEAVPDPRAASNVRYNPSFERLRAASSHLETTTEFGSPSYVSEAKSRSADRTRNAIDTDFDRSDWGVVQDAMEAVDDGTREFFCVDRMLGRHSDESYHCRLFVPHEHARIALAWAKMLEPAAGTDPDFAS